MLAENVKAFIVHISFLNLESMYLDRNAQIASLLTEKVTIPDKYSDFANIFSEQQASMLLK